MSINQPVRKHVNYNAGQPRDAKTGQMQQWNRDKAIPIPVMGDSVTQWWETMFALADVENNSAPVIGDDNTPGMYDGRSIDLLRHTHRRWYKGSDVNVRMPSVAAIRRMAREHPHEAFQIPVEMMVGGKQSLVWCDVVKGEHGMWSVEATTPTDRPWEAGEAVRAILECRTPSRAPLETGQLVKAYKKRVLMEGTPLVVVPQSSWVQSAGWQNGVMSVNLAGKQYAYMVPRKTFDAMMQAPSPGAFYNQNVKRRARHTWTDQCPKCHRVYLAKRGHRCPVVARVDKPMLDGEPELYGPNLRMWLHRQVMLDEMAVS